MIRPPAYFQQLAAGRIGAGQVGQPGLDRLPHRHGVETGALAVYGGQVMADIPLPFASGERVEIGFEGGGELETSLFIHRRRGISAETKQLRCLSTRNSSDSGDSI